MISTYKLFQVLRSPYISEKSNTFQKKNNIIIFKVSIRSNKNDIKLAVEKIFLVRVDSVNTIIMKGKKKKKGKYNIFHSNWKKAYVKVQVGQNLDTLKNIN